MKRFLKVAVSVVVAGGMFVALTPAYGNWLATTTVAAALKPSGIVVTKPILMTFRPWEVARYGDRPPGYILSYADVDKFRAAARTLPRGTTVMLDFESWSFTPKYQRRGGRALIYMHRFVMTAHRYHLVAGLCPSRMFLTGIGLHPGGEKIPADFFVAQLYLYGRDLRIAMARIRASRTGPIVVDQAHPLAFIMSQWRTVRPYTKRFVLWGVRDEASAQEAAAFLAAVT